MPHTERTIELAGLSQADQYAQVLFEWKRISQAQLAALEEADWQAFDRLIDSKAALMQAWETQHIDLDALTARTDSEMQARWESLATDIALLDERLERIVEHLMSEVKQDLREFGDGKRATRKYHSLPSEFSPSFHDKKY